MTDWAAARVPRLPAPPGGGYLDANGWLGEWPARRLNGSPPPARQALVEQRLRLMDRLGIQLAAVSLLESVWLKDCGTANVELHALVGARRDRFFPVYTLNPTFPIWQAHLERYRGDYGLAPGTGAVRLLPAYHGYRLEDGGADACLDRLAALDVPVLLTVQLEDARMHHPAMRVPDLAPASVLAAVGRWPAIRWVVANAVHAQALAIGQQLPPGARVWFDIARVQGPVDCLRSLRGALGAGRLLFGTNQPLHVAASPILELADAHLDPAEDAAVRYANARAALGIPPAA